MAEEKKVKAKNGKLKKFLTYAGVVALILAAVIISLLFYRQKIETTKTVVKNLTEDWQTFKDDKYGYSFKYPKDWRLTDLTGTPYESFSNGFWPQLIQHRKNDGTDTNINVMVLKQRNINIKDPNYAIQISIPFDKQNYLVFSTTTSLSDEEKEIFYNIPVTLVIGK